MEEINLHISEFHKLAYIQVKLQLLFYILHIYILYTVHLLWLIHGTGICFYIHRIDQTNIGY